MQALDRKLLRDLWHLRGQALAIALVIACGIGIYVMSKSTLAALGEARGAYYDAQRLAQIIAPVRRAPEHLVVRLARIPGVSQVRGRIRQPALLDVPNYAAPVSAELLSLPAEEANRGSALNSILLRSGHWPDPHRPQDVLVLDAFSLAHGLHPGDSLVSTLHGRQWTLTITGTATSPEHIYVIPPGDIVPDDRRYGVIWADSEFLASASDMEGAANEFLATLTAGTNPEAAIRAFDDILSAYGSAGAYGRERQLSDQFLRNEIDQLETMSWLLPPIFLLVSGFLLHIVLSRLVATERESIGLLKAFGYTNTQVRRHYLGLVGVITFAGCLLGIVLGGALSFALNRLYLQYFHFPALPFHLPISAVITAVASTVGVALAATHHAVMQSAKLDPASAMQPPTPPDYSRLHASSERLGRHLSPASRMILRHLTRWPGRAAMTLIGMALSMSLLIASSFSLDAIRHMVDVSFNRADRQDMRVSFFQDLPASALRGLAEIPGVLQVEGIRAAAVSLRFRNQVRQESLIGLPDNPILSRVLDRDLNPVTVPRDSLVLSRSLAERLGASLGDRVEVQWRSGHQRTHHLHVGQIIESYMGTGAYLHQSTFERLSGQGSRFVGANLIVDGNQQNILYAALKRLPSVSGIAQLDQAQKAFENTLEESMGSMIFFNTLFAGLIVVGVVYNSARVALSERGRELASLRVLGMRHDEVAFILLGELWVLTLLSLPLGAMLGTGLAALLTTSLDTELFRLPLVISSSTYAWGAIIVCVATAGSGLLVRRRLRQLDLIAVLKTRE